jgi:hypothetical protein
VLYVNVFLLIEQVCIIMLVVWLVLAGGGSTNGHLQVIIFAFIYSYFFVKVVKPVLKIQGGGGRG